jgi:hypothetical protein
MVGKPFHKLQVEDRRISRSSCMSDRAIWYTNLGLSTIACYRSLFAFELEVGQSTSGIKRSLVGHINRLSGVCASDMQATANARCSGMLLGKHAESA